MSELPPPFPVDLPPPMPMSVVESRPTKIQPLNSIPVQSTHPLSIIACACLPFGLIPGLGLAAGVMAFALGVAALGAIRRNPLKKGETLAQIGKNGAFAIAVLQLVFLMPVLAWLYQIDRQTDAAKEVGLQAVDVANRFVTILEKFFQ